MIDLRMVPQQILSSWKEFIEVVPIWRQFGTIRLKVALVYGDQIVD